MEPRQVRSMLLLENLRGHQVSLLGLWGSPRYPHLHDPFGLSPRYCRVCFERISNAVQNLPVPRPTAHVEPIGEGMRSGQLSRTK